jgi:electron transfer flavoprotein alpha subunit
MGPPQARDGLLECLALGADRAILLTDRALAGSDTLATARALSLALKKEAPDLIICGRNSADSETGQVGPETAELMDIPHVGQVSKLDLNADSNTIVTERLTDEGYQVIECPLPALVCVTEGVAEETFPNREQLAEAETKPLQEVTCAQLSPDSSQFGAEGSPTWVEEIRLVEPNRSGVIIEEEDPQVAAEQAASLLKERLAELDSADNGSQTAQPTERFPNSRDKSIWVIAESWPADLAHVTLELLGKARELTSFTRSEVAAVLIGPAQPDLNGQLAAYGADRVLVLDNTGKGPVWGRQVVQSLAAAVHQAQPYAVLFASTPDGRDLASRVAARLALGLTGDAIDLEIDEEGRLVQLKPALGGNVVAPILSKTLPNMVTLRPGLLTPVAPVVSSQAPVEAIAAASFDGPDVTVLEEHVQEDIGALELTQAQVVLGVGMGIGGPENLPQIQKLAHSINASLATTRNVTHEGWLPVQIQVGISGRSITPKVYLAVGIRGAFNHTVGIQKAGVILALNQNRRHAIFKSADFGIVGDWNEFLPPLIEALKPVLAELG